MMEEEDIIDRIVPTLSRDRKGFDYKNIALVGKGSYGQVYLFERQGQLVENLFTKFFFGEQSFDSKLPQSNNQGVTFSTLRQLNFMLTMKHPNIVNAHQIFAKNQVISVVMDFHLQLTDIWTDQAQHDEFNKKLICHHITKGLAYLHRYHIMHRDLNPQNIFASKNGDVKIGDFGMSKDFGTANQKLTPDVCTIFYRSPELFFDTNYYTQKIDIWSLGCIFYYVYTGDHLFYNQNSNPNPITILSRIFSITGIPNEKDWKGYQHLPRYFQFQAFQRRNLSKEKGLDPEVAETIQWCLQLDPKRRPTAQQILQSEMFKNLIFGLDQRKLDIQSNFNKKLQKLLLTQ